MNLCVSKTYPYRVARLAYRNIQHRLLVKNIVVTLSEQHQLLHEVLWLLFDKNSEPTIGQLECIVMEFGLGVTCTIGVTRNVRFQLQSHLYEVITCNIINASLLQEVNQSVEFVCNYGSDPLRSDVQWYNNAFGRFPWLNQDCQSLTCTVCRTMLPWKY